MRVVMSQFQAEEFPQSIYEVGLSVLRKATSAACKVGEGLVSRPLEVRLARGLAARNAAVHKREN